LKPTTRLGDDRTLRDENGGKRKSCDTFVRLNSSTQFLFCDTSSRTAAHDQAVSFQNFDAEREGSAPLLFGFARVAACRLLQLGAKDQNAQVLSFMAAGARQVPRYAPRNWGYRERRRAKQDRPRCPLPNVSLHPPAQPGYPYDDTVDRERHEAPLP